MLWRAFPIVDPARSSLLDLIASYNDGFFMALFFLLAGLFTWRGLAKKGVGPFLRGRGRRLGIPFIICAAFLAPLAYYPSYLQHGGEPSLGPFSSAWSSLGVWPAGPAWFLWVLLAFSALAALVTTIAPQWGETLGRRLGPLGERPAVLFALLVAVSAGLYLGVTQFVDPMSWFEWGPFSVQTSRILHYGLYFLVGVGLGSYGIDRGLLAPSGRLARRWPLWMAASLTLFVALMVGVITLLSQLQSGSLNPVLQQVVNFGFPLSCAASSFFLMALFLQFGHRGGSLWRSLGRNAFGIYLLHYLFVSWLQFALLDMSLGAVTKATLVFSGAVVLSWGVTILLRRIPFVAKTI